MLPAAVLGQGVDEDVEALLARMSPMERVGQLFIVGFPGDFVEQQSVILEMIRTYRIGGVVITSDNQKFMSSEATAATLQRLIGDLQGAALSTRSLVAPTPSAQGTPESSAPMATPSAATPSPEVTQNAHAPAPTEGTPDVEGTPSQTTPESSSPTVVVTPSPESTPVSSTPTLTASAPGVEVPVATRPVGGVPIPLFVAMAPEEINRLAAGSGSHPNLNMMALGATWDIDLAEKSGAAMGRALYSLGVNMLFGPTADLSNPSRAGLPGDQGARVLGESPFWVSVLAEAYVGGVHTGSGGSVLSIVAHFPGWGASDRNVYEEVPVVQGSLESHLQTDLLPFVRLVALSAGGVSKPADGFLVSHVQFRGVTSTTQMARPVSFDPQALQYFLALPEVKPWRASGGLTVSDSLGAASVRRLYDPEMEDFQAKRIAYDAFLAGNDLLNLDFVGDDGEDWEGHFQNVRETIEFFHSKYVSDQAFRSRVDDSVRRILSAKRRLYPRFVSDSVIPQPQRLVDWDKGWEDLSSLTSASVTLVHPRFDELVARIPSPPSVTDKIVILEDVRLVAPCAGCEPVERPASGTTFALLQDLYGQRGSGHVDMTRVQSYRFTDLKEYLESGETLSEWALGMEKALNEATWLIFLAQDPEPGGGNNTDALKELLQKKASLLQGKRVVLITCGAPYYMDSTDIAKISAFYAVYSVAQPAIESGLRALFRETVPSGISPVSIPGVQYSIADRLQPAADQMLYAEPVGDAQTGAAATVSIGLGDDLVLTTGLIRDRNGNLVPDGTGVTFLFSYPSARIAWQQNEAARDGRARTTVRLDTPGTLEVAVASGEAKGTTRLVVTIEGDKPAVISTIVPAPSPTAVPTEKPASVFPGEPEPSRADESRRFDVRAFLLTLSGLALICAALWALGYHRRLGWLSVEIALLAFCAGMLGYLVYGFSAAALERLAWFANLKEALSWQWQSAIFAWLGAGAVGVLGWMRPLLIGKAAGLLRPAGKGGSDSERQQK
jgi:beta-N-acetylhexosaminidase